jgi:hypothetical protein
MASVWSGQNEDISPSIKKSMPTSMHCLNECKAAPATDPQGSEFPNFAQKLWDIYAFQIKDESSYYKHKFKCSSQIIS